jgi:glycosyltransferase involved in cell wall biosynthesis
MKCGGRMITVGIATYNRASVLKETLGNLKDVIPPKSQWELIVVDNNSTDDTKQVCDSALPSNGRYLLEPARGVSNARNRVFAEAKGDLIVFTDDDATPCKKWLIAYEEGASDYPSSAYFTGPVSPIRQYPQPWWFKDNPTHKINYFNTDDLGGVDIPINADVCIPGVNMAVRKDAYTKIGGFSEQFGIIGSKRIGGEEQDLIQRFKKEGLTGHYLASARVGHRIDPGLTTAHSLMATSYAAGSSDSEILREYTSEPNLMGMPRWWWRSLIESPIIHVGHAVGHLALGQTTQFMHHVFKIGYWAGMIKTFWQPRRLVCK